MVAATAAVVIMVVFVVSGVDVVDGTGPRGPSSSSVDRRSIKGIVLDEDLWYGRRLIVVVDDAYGRKRTKYI